MSELAQTDDLTVVFRQYMFKLHFTPTVKRTYKEMMHLLYTTMLAAHIILGSLAVIAGTVALVAKKGASWHIKAGTIFAWSMILSSLIGAIIGAINYSAFLITAFAGILGVVLIASSLLTLKSKQKYVTFPAYGLAILNGLNCISLISVGLIALEQTGTKLFGFVAEDYFFLAAMTLVVLVGDCMYFMAKNIEPHRRIARHLWRMCLGFFIAAGSAFTGPGMAVFPQAIQESGLLSLPELLILAAMLFWLIKTWFFSKPKG